MYANRDCIRTRNLKPLILDKAKQNHVCMLHQLY